MGYVMHRPCIACGTLIPKGSRCDTCKPKRKPRDTAHAGTDWRWRKLSKRLRTASPFCEIPGCRSKDLTVDHIVPVSEAPNLAYDELNCRVICRGHNAARGATCTDHERQQVLSAVKARKRRLASYYANQP
jgi:5-methylcytosine-specific restriction endonuclease McrA